MVAERDRLREFVEDHRTNPIRLDSVRADTKTAVVERVAELATQEHDDVSILDGIRITPSSAR